MSNLETGTIVSEELDTTEGIISEPEVEEEETQTQEEISSESDQESEEDSEAEAEQVNSKQKRNAKKVQKLLAAKNDLANRVQILERENNIVKLENKYGGFDAEAVSEIKENSTLSWEDSYLLREAKNKKPEQKKSVTTFIGRDATKSDTGYVTMEDLKKMDYDAYNRAKDDLESGKLKLKK